MLLPVKSVFILKLSVLSLHTQKSTYVFLLVIDKLNAISESELGILLPGRASFPGQASRFH